jgi:hypothetical protein
MTQTSEPRIKSEPGAVDIEAVETIDTSLEVRRSARAHAAETIRTLLFSAVSESARHDRGFERLRS